MKKISELISAMIVYEAGQPERIDHFMMVYAYAKTIGTLEGISQESQFILEAAAVVHDIGIKPAILKFGSPGLQYQKVEGPPAARKMLTDLAFDTAFVDRVCFLITHLHQNTNIDTPDYRILLESSHLVDLAERTIPINKQLKETVFTTETGLFFFDQLFFG